MALACVWWIGGARAQDAPPSSGAVPQDAHLLTLAAQAGRHWRIDGPRGPIHVWIPPGYRAETAATIVYIHGYYDDADTAYVGHRLPEQFAMSALNAMFIVVEAPSAVRPAL